MGGRTNSFLTEKKLNLSHTAIVEMKKPLSLLANVEAKSP